jgi:transcriptional regulator with XRE-family HTH domain
MSDPDADLAYDITGRDPAAIGRRLLLTRKVFDLNQKEFSKRANVGNSAYNQFENGVQRPSIESATALCDTYHLTLDWIYLGDMRGLRHETATAILALVEVRRVLGGRNE